LYKAWGVAATLCLAIRPIEIRVSQEVGYILCPGNGAESVARKSLLKEEGTTYIQLLNDTRKELASRYISNSRLSISEISYLLGFAEPTNFTRAFRRWTGKSPSEYRMSA
jgi:methylphosphotriester-DNA--protein-cysteine methyltransferase